MIKEEAWKKQKEEEFKKLRMFIIAALPLKRPLLVSDVEYAINKAYDKGCRLGFVAGTKNKCRCKK